MRNSYDKIAILFFFLDNMFLIETYSHFYQVKYWESYKVTCFLLLIYNSDIKFIFPIAKIVKILQLNYELIFTEYGIPNLKCICVLFFKN